MQHLHKELPDKVQRPACTEQQAAVLCCAALCRCACRALRCAARWPPPHNRAHVSVLPPLLCLQIGTSGTFDADAYRQQVAANAALQQQLKHQKHGSAAESECCA